MVLFASDADYPTLWQHVTRLKRDCLRYGSTGKRHLRLALLHLAAANYVLAERESRRSQQRSHDLPEATHALALALLGQALVRLGLVEPGPGSPSPRMHAGELVDLAQQALQDYLRIRPDDQDARTLALLLADRAHVPDALARLAGRT